MDNFLSRQELEKRVSWYEKKYGPYIGDRGLKNWKNLFRRPNIYELTILFMLLMSFFIAWAYIHDVSMCREFIKEQENIFIENVITYPTPSFLNLSNYDNLFDEDLIKLETNDSG
jgi:hypothetical protein